MKTDFKFKGGAPFFTTERLSPHKEKTPEGYLLCRDVPISRVGTFDYAGSDVGFADVPVVHVSRPEDELFNPDTMASLKVSRWSSDMTLLLIPTLGGGFRSDTYKTSVVTVIC